MPRLTKDPPELIALRTEIAAGMAYLNINRTELARRAGHQLQHIKPAVLGLGEYENE